LINLIPPVLNAEEVYMEVIRRAKSNDKKNCLTLLKSTIFEGYKSYDLNKLNLECIGESVIKEDSQKRYLQSNYNRNKDGYLEGQVVDVILKAQTPQLQNTCPYCGIDRPITIDHYLPQTEYPEYSIYPPNLIPCCGRCNSIKNDRWIKDCNRLIINFYYDNIPFHKNYLVATLTFKEFCGKYIPKFKFDLIFDQGFKEKDTNLIINHYKTLKLIQQYKASLEEIVSNIYDGVVHNSFTAEEHKKNLNITLGTFERKYGVNYWEAVVYRTIINNDEFFEKIYQEKLMVR